MTLIRFERREANTQTPYDGFIKLTPSRRYVVDNNPDFTVMPTNLWVDLVDGVGTVEAPVLPLGWAYEFEEKLHNKKLSQTWWGVVPDVPGPIDDSDIPRVNPTTLAPAPNDDPAWLAEAENLQDQINGIVGSDINTVAGVAPDLGGDVPVAELQTAMSLPADTAAAISTLGNALGSEITTRGNADSALGGRLDTVETDLSGRLSNATLSATYAGLDDPLIYSIIFGG